MNAPCYKDSPKVSVIEGTYFKLPDPEVSPDRPCCEGFRERYTFLCLEDWLAETHQKGDSVDIMTCKSCYFFGGNHERNADNNR